LLASVPTYLMQTIKLVLVAVVYINSDWTDRSS